MSDEKPTEMKLKIQPDVVTACPLCGAEFEGKGDGNVETKCPACNETFIVRKL